MALFEGYERRVEKINSVLNKYGISSIEEAKKIAIEAIIYVERESQKGIIIGHQGVAIKKVMTEARKELERFFDKTIYLRCFVKVDKDWRSNDKELKHFGYQLED